MVCSEISFDEKVAADYPAVDVARHMRENSYQPQDIVGVSVSYNELLPFDDAIFPPLATSKDGIPLDYSIVYVDSQIHPLFRWLNVPRLAGCYYGAIGGAKAGATTGALVGSIVPLEGTATGGVVGGVVGGVGGCFVGGYVAGEVTATSYDFVVGEESSEFKAYAYSFVKPKGDSDFQTSVLVVPSGSFEDQCDRLY